MKFKNYRDTDVRVALTTGYVIVVKAESVSDVPETMVDACLGAGLIPENVDLSGSDTDFDEEPTDAEAEAKAEADAEALKRSEAAKKGAETRKANAEAKAKGE